MLGTAIVHRIVKREFADNVNQEDLVQAGMLALIRCRRRYSPERGGNFSLFASRAVRQEIRREVDREVKHSGVAVFVDDKTAVIKRDGVWHEDPSWYV